MRTKVRRGGRPLTEAQRRARHKRIYGSNSTVPPRGTGLKKQRTAKK